MCSQGCEPDASDAKAQTINQSRNDDLQWRMTDGRHVLPHQHAHDRSLRKRTLDLLVKLLASHMLAGHWLLAKPFICGQQLILREGVGLDDDLFVEGTRVIDCLGQDSANICLICGCT